MSALTLCQFVILSVVVILSGSEYVLVELQDDIIDSYWDGMQNVAEEVDQNADFIEKEQAEENILAHSNLKTEDKKDKELDGAEKISEHFKERIIDKDVANEDNDNFRSVQEVLFEDKVRELSNVRRGENRENIDIWVDNKPDPYVDGLPEDKFRSVKNFTSMFGKSSDIAENYLPEDRPRTLLNAKREKKHDKKSYGKGRKDTKMFSYRNSVKNVSTEVDKILDSAENELAEGKVKELKNAKGKEEKGQILKRKGKNDHVFSYRSIGNAVDTQVNNRSDTAARVKAEDKLSVPSRGEKKGSAIDGKTQNYDKFIYRNKANDSIDTNNSSDTVKGLAEDELKALSFMIREEEKAKILDGADKNEKNFGYRNGVNDVNRQWTDGIVPVNITKDESSKIYNVIKMALNTMNYLLRGCILFRPAGTGDAKTMLVVDGPGCGSSVGMGRHGSTVSLHDTCSFGKIIHELVHTLGFQHEHVRPDRDRYVRVLWQNVQERVKEAEFFKRDDSNRTFGVPYNYYSIMHYSSYFFHKGPELRPTLEFKQPVDKIGIQLSGLPTRSDLIKIRRMYKCKEPAFPIKCPWYKVRALQDSICVKASRSTKKSFRAANEHCQRLNTHARLYEPWDYTTYRPLVDLLRSDYNVSRGPFWVGGIKEKNGARPSYPSRRDIPWGFMDCRALGKYCGLQESTEQCSAIFLGEKEGERPHVRMYPCEESLQFVCEIPEVIRN